MFRPTSITQNLISVVYKSQLSELRWMYVEFSFPKCIVLNEERTKQISFIIVCGELKEIIELTLLGDSKYQRNESETIRFTPEKVEDFKSIIFELVDERELSVGRIEVKNISETYCNGFTFNHNLAIEGGYFPVKVRFKNFPILVSMEERFPFYKLFSPIYQFQPLLKNIITYLSPIDVIQSISKVSKHVQMVAKEMSFDNVVLPLDFQSPNSESFLSFFKDFRIINLTIPKLTNIPKYPTFDRLCSSLVKLEIWESNKEVVFTETNIFFILLPSCPNLMSIFLGDGRVFSPLEEEDLHKLIFEENYEQHPLESFQTKSWVAFHDTFIKSLFKTCPHLHTIELGVRGDREEDENDLHKKYRTELPDFPTEKDSVTLNDEQLNISFPLDQWSPEIEIRSHSEGLTYLFLDGLLWEIFVGLEENWSDKFYDEASHLIVFTCRLFLDPELTIANRIQNIDVTLEVRNHKFNVFQRRRVVFSHEEIRDSVEQVFVVGKLSTEQIKFENFSDGLKFRYKTNHRYRKKMGDLRREMKSKILRDYPIGASLKERNVDSVELHLDLEKLSRDANSLIEFKEVVKLGPCKGNSFMNSTIQINYNPKEKIHGMFLAMDVNSPYAFIADYTFHLNNVTLKWNGRLFAPRAGKNSYGFSPIQGVEYEESPPRYLRAVVILEIKEILDMEELAEMTERLAGRAAQAFQNREGLEGRTGKGRFQIGKTLKTLSEERIRIIDNLDWQIIFYREFGCLKKPAVFINSVVFSTAEDYILDFEFTLTKIDDSLEPPLELISSRRLVYGEFKSWGFVSNRNELFDPRTETPVEYELFVKIVGIHEKGLYQKNQEDRIVELFQQQVTEEQGWIEDTAELKITESVHGINIQNNFSAFGFTTWNLEFFPLGMAAESGRMDYVGLELQHPFVHLNGVCEKIEYHMELKDDLDPGREIEKVMAVEKNVVYNSSGGTIAGICKGHEDVVGSWTIRLTVKMFKR